MAYRTRWGTVVAVVGALAGCAEGALDEEVAATDAGTNVGTDAGTDAGAVADAGTDAGTERPLVPTRVLAPAPPGTAYLVGDTQAVYGVTDGDDVWALPAGETTPRVLARAGTPSGRPGAIAVSGGDLFWIDRSQGVLYRMHTDGTSLVPMAANLDNPGALAVDEARVYWTDTTYMHMGGGVVRSLPRDGTLQDRPDTLVTTYESEAVGPLAAWSGSLYWAPFGVIGSTMYIAPLTTAPIDALLAGGSGTLVDGLGSTTHLLVNDGKLLVVYYRGWWVSTIARIDAVGAAPYLISLLPFGVAASGIAVLDHGVAIAVTGDHDLYVAPADTGAPIVIAHGLRTAAVDGPDGATFVDSAGNLAAIAVSDVVDAIFNRAR